MDGDPVDDAVAVFADQVVERLQILAHRVPSARRGSRPGGRRARRQWHRKTQPARSTRRGCCLRPARPWRRRRSRARRSGGRLAPASASSLASDSRRRLPRSGTGSRRSGPKSRRRSGGSNSSTRASTAAFWYVDRAAQLRLARVELLAPARRRRVEDAECLSRAIPQKSGQALARAFEPFAKSLAAVDDGLVQAVGRAVEARDQIVAVDETTVSESRSLAASRPFEQRPRTFAEVAGERVARFAEAVRRPSRPGRGSPRPSARLLELDAADDLVGVAVHGGAHDRATSRRAALRPNLPAH